MQQRSCPMRDRGVIKCSLGLVFCKIEKKMQFSKYLMKEKFDYWPDI